MVKTLWDCLKEFQCN